MHFPLCMWPVVLKIEQGKNPTHLCQDSKILFEVVEVVIQLYSDFMWKIPLQVAYRYCSYSLSCSTEKWLNIFGKSSY